MYAGIGVANTAIPFIPLQFGYGCGVCKVFVTLCVRNHGLRGFHGRRGEDLCI